jgi:hypothetical protein
MSKTPVILNVIHNGQNPSESYSHYFAQETLRYLWTSLLGPNTESVEISAHCKILLAALMCNIMSRTRCSWLSKKLLYYMAHRLAICYKLSGLEFWTSLIKLVSPFLSHRKFRVCSGRRIVYVKGNARRGALRLFPVPYSVEIL